MSDDDRCPCGSGDTYSACCAPIVRGSRAAPTAEQLMRSRYTAFVIGDVAHLLASWHPSTRPESLDTDENISWWRLDILSSSSGGPFDSQGIVHFIAHYRTADGRGRQEEVSEFIRENGHWYYVDGRPIAS